MRGLVLSRVRQTFTLCKAYRPELMVQDAITCWVTGLALLCVTLLTQSLEYCQSLHLYSVTE